MFWLYFACNSFYAYFMFLYHLLSFCPGQTLQHRPGRSTGSMQVGFGHSVLIFLHRTLPTILFFLGNWKRMIQNTVNLSFYTHCSNCDSEPGNLTVGPNHIDFVRVSSKSCFLYIILFVCTSILLQKRVQFANS